MKYSIEDKGKFAILKLSEKRLIIDLLDPVYKNIITESESLDKNVLINMEEVEYIDSFAVGFIMEIFRKLLDAGNNLSLSGVNDKIDTLLRITRVNNVVKVYNTKEEALKELGK